LKERSLTEFVRTGFAGLNGTDFYYEVEGEGRTLVLVHAGIADRRMWDRQFHAFARRYRVIRYDRRGFGKTRTGAGAYSHHRDLHSLLGFLGVERAFLLGSSQGGKTIIDFALEHPEMADALILVASALSGFTFKGAAPSQWEELEAADERGDVARVNELELQIWVDGPHRTPEEVDPEVRHLVREMNLVALSAPSAPGAEQPLEPPAAGRLGEIRAPALVVVGDLDTPRTLATADLLTENIRGARKVVVRGAAHLVNMEKPEEFNRHVTSFLAACSRTLQIAL
jgi:pimeloyl-ACP methyl ester carboxylesterase